MKCLSPLIGIAIVLGSAFSSAFAQAQPFIFEKEPARHALVIGNVKYKHLATLESAEADARGMAEKLNAFGFARSPRGVCGNSKLLTCILTIEAFNPDLQQFQEI